MDPSVIRAIAKWPNVPAVYGWLGLDRRGRWRLRGETIGNRAAREFIGRNYGSDARGRWYFQNGPQQVFVELAYMPWVYMLDAAGGLLTHTGLTVRDLTGVWIDDGAGLVLQSEHGPGAVSDRDLEPMLAHFTDPDGKRLADESVEAAIERLATGDAGGLCFEWHGRRLPIGAMSAADAPARLGFEPAPEPPADGLA